MDDARIAWKIREKIHQFSGNLSADLPKTAQRLVREVGSTSSRVWESIRPAANCNRFSLTCSRNPPLCSCRPSRSMIFLIEMFSSNERAISLSLTDPRDCTPKKSPTSGSGPVWRADARACIVDANAKKMQYLAPVRDGSEGRIQDGYWCCQVVGARCGSAQVLPLYQELYSQKASDFVSENDEILKAIRRVSGAPRGGRGTWVMGRGADRQEILHKLIGWELPFLVRQRGDRHLRWGRRWLSVEQIAGACRRRYRETIIKEDPQGEKVYHLDFGSQTVRFPGFDQKLSLVVMDGFGSRPMMLLTSLRVTRSRKSLWRVEETIRFIKQSYQLEDSRLLTYERLRSMATLVMAVAYFACVYLGKVAKLKILLQHILSSRQTDLRNPGVPLLCHRRWG